MRALLVATALMGMTASAVWGQAVPSGTNKLKTADGGTIAIQAVEIDGIGSDTIVLRERARTKLFDRSGVLVFDAQADKIVVTLLLGAAKTADGKDSSVRSAELIGHATMNYVATDPETGAPIAITATGKSAKFDGLERNATLSGDAKIIYENAAVFDGPAVMTGDEAMVNLKTSIGPEDVRFRIRTNPPGVSTVQAKPRGSAGGGK